MPEEERKNSLLDGDPDLKKKVRHRSEGKGRVVFFAFCGLVILAALVWGLYRLTLLVTNAIQDSYSNVWLSDTDIDNIEELRMELSSGKTVTLHSDGQMYHANELPDALLDQDACQTAFANAAQLLAERQAADKAADASAFGLDEPQAVLTIAYKDGGSRSIEFGAEAPTTAQTYVRVRGEEAVYLMRGLLVDLYAGGLSAFRDVSGFAIDTASVSALQLETPDGPTLLLDYVSKPAGFRFTAWSLREPFLSDVQNDVVEAFLSAIGSLELDSYAGECESAEALAAFGLDEPALRITLSYGDGSGVTVDVGGADRLGNRYLRFNDGNEVYLGKKDSLTFLDGLPLPSLVNPFANILQYKNVSAMTVTLDGQTTRFTIDRSGDETEVRADGQKVDEAAFKEAFLAICAVERADVVYGRPLPADAETFLRLDYKFENGETGCVEYIDATVNDYYLAKNGEIGVCVRKGDCEDFLQKLRSLLP